MSVSGFHIVRNSKEDRRFIFSELSSDGFLHFIPFEKFHKDFFHLPLLDSKYPIPEMGKIALKEVSENEISRAEIFSDTENFDIVSSLSKEEYISKVNQIKKHIHRGDIYEMNYCFEFYAKNVLIDPFQVFEKLYSVSQAPFSSLTKINDLYLICCSPERFLKKVGDKIISEPMKGTAPRFRDTDLDEKSKVDLKNNPKEQNENVMIVDLVRNDLSRIAKRGTVQVEELFGIKSFSTVHQMISTISCINNGFTNDEILNATFPMGSMTGAPKKRTLELINQYEKNTRGIYSGAIGIEEPNGDFDLAVIIRSIVYDSKNKYLSFSVGSAITAGCDAEKEYEECLLKAKTMIDSLKP